MTTSPASQGGSILSRKWGISGLLMLATMLNYMDRQTLANLSVRITSELQLTQERYGDLELAFGWAFACGSLFFGAVADRVPLRWLYSIVVIGWSTMGILAGFSDGFTTMLVCRTLLGFFEAGHWPCALKATLALLSREDRIFGNSILQSGGAIGAIVTPLAIRSIMGNDMTPGAWRSPFIVIGCIGFIWVIVWFVVISKAQLQKPADETTQAEATSSASRSRWAWLSECMNSRKFWALLPMVICINITWQLLRAWMPKFLQEGRGSTEQAALLFNSLYYAAADVGCIGAGAAGLWLARRGMSVRGSRFVIIGTCAVLTALTTFTPFLPLGVPLYGVLLIIGAGALGIFPCYYSMSQEISEKNMGKATGLLGALSWLISSPLQKYFGRVVDRTGSFDLGFALAGWAPMLALIILVIVWPRNDDTAQVTKT
jgi:ACS family hexuronate transporter-like MFS transporter